MFKLAKILFQCVVELLCSSGWPETLIKFGLHIQFFFCQKTCLVVRASVSVSMFLDDMTNFHVPSDIFIALHNFIYYQRFHRALKFLFYSLLQRNRTKMARGIRLNF